MGPASAGDPVFRTAKGFQSRPFGLLDARFRGHDAAGLAASFLLD